MQKVEITLLTLFRNTRLTSVMVKKTHRIWQIIEKSPNLHCYHSFQAAKASTTAVRMVCVHDGLCVWFRHLVTVWCGCVCVTVGDASSRHLYAMLQCQHQ